MDQYITFDLETLGNNFNAPIVQIGAVKFDDGIFDEFKTNILFTDLEKYGFEMDYSTILWWLSQSREAQDSIIDQTAAVSLKDALEAFGKWIGDSEQYFYWSHATFDPVILSNAYRKVGIKNPISFRRQYDIRTLNHLAGYVDMKNPGISHDALDDARHQANYITEMLKILNKHETRR